MRKYVLKLHTHLAAIHAYFDASYLPSVLLAVSPNIGVAIWAIHGFDEYVAFMPWRFVGILPEGLLVATLGFLLGLGLRRIRKPNSPSRPVEPATPER